MFITYKTVCKITGKYYIGSHKTCDINDDYLGSGKQLQESIKLYGANNHYRLILGVFDNRADSVMLEHSLIKDAKNNNDSLLLNLNSGGYCFDTVNEQRKNLYKITEQNLQQRLRNLEKGRKTFQERMLDPVYSNNIREQRSQLAKQYFQNHENGFKGKKHSEKTRKVISEKAKQSSSGVNNSQYGTFWITNGVNNKKWHPDKGMIPDGYYKGRVTK